MRNLQYNVMVGNYKFDTVNTLEKANAYKDLGYRVVPVLVKTDKSQEELKAVEECYRKIRERNPQNVDRRAIRFAAVG